MDEKNLEQQNLQELAALLNDRQMTNGEGNLVEGEETPTAPAAMPEQETPATEAPTAEKPEEPSDAETQSASKASENDEESELGVDDTGKRYVPERKFKRYYKQAKELEAELARLRAQQPQTDASTRPTSEPVTPSKSTKAAAESAPSKADVIELKLELPQFDPKPDPETGLPTNPNYSAELDQLGYQIYKANPGMSLVEAGRQAIKLAKSLSKQVAQAQTEARTVKAIQSDQGITSRAGERGNAPIDPASMTLEQMEEWLRANGEW